ncbi:MAG TPA: OFA family MFS transporter [Vicinamibacterales bacterium]|jgi:OFA family oxalate/formate antiporter-like MFS transporter
MNRHHPLPRWPALVGGGLLNVAIGTYYAWSVFVPPLEREFGWTRPQTSLVPTIDMVMLASTFLLAGFIQNRVGPRAIATFGGAMFSLGLFLASFTTSLGMLYLTWGVMVGVGLGFGYLPPISVGSKWFPHQRGLVNGLAIGIFAGGSGVFGPFAGWMMPYVGWRTTFQVLAGIFFVFTMTGAYLLKDPPDDFVAPKVKSRRAAHRAVHHPDVKTSRVIRQGTFYLLWIAYALGTTAGTMVISQLVPFARESGLTPQIAAFAISVGAIGSATGRFFSGWMSDHFGRLSTLRAIIFISMLATPTLYVFRQEVVLFYVFLFLVYYCYGTQLSVYTALAGDFFGTRYLSTNYGLLLLAWGFAGVLGPQIGSRIRVGLGTYQYAFFGSALLALLALGLLTIIRPPKPVDEPIPVLVEG